MGRKIEAQLNTGEPILFQTGSPFPRDWPLVVGTLAVLIVIGVFAGEVFDLPTYLNVLNACLVLNVSGFVIADLYQSGAVVTDNRLIYRHGAGNEMRETPLSSITSVHTDGARVAVICGADALHLGYLRDPEGLARALATHGRAHVKMLLTGKRGAWSRVFGFGYALGIVLPLVPYFFAFSYLFAPHGPSGGHAAVLGTAALLVLFSPLPYGFFTGVLFLLIVLFMRLFLSADEACAVMAARRQFREVAQKDTLPFDRIPFALARRFAGLLYGRRI